MPIHTYERLWFYSASCAPFSGAMAIVDVAGPVSATDTLNGPNSYSNQLNMIAADESQIQLLLNFYSSGLQLLAMEAPSEPGEAINNEDAAYVFQIPINQAPTNKPVSPLAAGSGWLLALLGSSVMFWPRMNAAFQGAPVLQTIPFSKQLQSVSLDIVANGGGSLVQFGQGSAFNVSVKLEGIADGTYSGIDDLTTYTPPILCGGSMGLNTLENSNLLEDLDSVDIANAFYQLVYHV
jgi:hypothetical protein